MMKLRQLQRSGTCPGQPLPKQPTQRFVGCSPSCHNRHPACHAIPDSWQHHLTTPLDAAEATCSHAHPEELQAAPFASASGNSLLTVSDRVSPLSEKLGVPNDVLLGGLMLTQAVTLVGSYVTGTLARKRRVELTKVNGKLRTVIHELRKKQEEVLVCEAAPLEAGAAYERALQHSKARTEAEISSSEEETIEAYGKDNMRVSYARRQVSKDLYDAKDRIAASDPEGALRCLEEAARISEDALDDKRARRAVLRVTASAHKMQGNADAVISDLREALEISKQLGDFSGDVDTYGALADAYVDKDDLENASKLYDDMSEAIQNEDAAQALTSWDC